MLDRQRDLTTLRAMDWAAFERVVGEAYRRLGFVIQETGQGGADGGIDLVLWKDHRKTIVQVKQWRSSSVGVSVVREMFGLMMHHKAQAVTIVCVGRFTNDAWRFAQGKPIDLVGGARLLEMIKEVQQ
ncbi:restriction endonuclease [Undibacterium arcticum]